MTLTQSLSLFRNANVNDLFIEAKSSGQLETGEAVLGQLRLVEVISNKIFSITRPEQTLESLQVINLKWDHRHFVNT